MKTHPLRFKLYEALIRGFVLDLRGQRFRFFDQGDAINSEIDEECKALETGVFYEAQMTWDVKSVDMIWVRFGDYETLWKNYILQDPDRPGVKVDEKEIQAIL